MGRWAGRPGVDRRSAGRTQGPAGRRHRPRPAQARAPGRGGRGAGPRLPPRRGRAHGRRWSIPLLEGGEVVGAIDFQSERPAAFDLDDVAVGETLAEFLVVALRNARLFARGAGAAGLGPASTPWPQALRPDGSRTNAPSRRGDRESLFRTRAMVRRTRRPGGRPAGPSPRRWPPGVRAGAPGS